MLKTAEARQQDNLPVEVLHNVNIAGDASVTLWGFRNVRWRYLFRVDEDDGVDLQDVGVESADGHEALLGVQLYHNVDQVLRPEEPQTHTVLGIDVRSIHGGQSTVRADDWQTI